MGERRIAQLPPELDLLIEEPGEVHPPRRLDGRVERGECLDDDQAGHLAPARAADHHNPVDGHEVPVPHFGVVLDWDDFHALAARLHAGGVKFVIEPYIRFQGQVGEQATMFFKDPSGNALEFKSFRDRSQLFAK